jgi:hypothetical protein
LTEGTPQYETTVVIGCPVGRVRQRRLGISRYLPPIGSTKEVCSVCRKHLWVSREQRAFVEVHAGETNFRFKCFNCSAEDLAKSDLASLDARPGQFYF